MNKQKVYIPVDKKDCSHYIDDVGELLPVKETEAFVLSESIFEKMNALIEKASRLIGNPGANVSASTDIACDNWQKEYEYFKSLQLIIDGVKSGMLKNETNS